MLLISLKNQLYLSIFTDLASFLLVLLDRFELWHVHTFKTLANLFWCWSFGSSEMPSTAFKPDKPQFWNSCFTVARSLLQLLKVSKNYISLVCNYATQNNKFLGPWIENFWCKLSQRKRFWFWRYSTFRPTFLKNGSLIWAIYVSEKNFFQKSALERMFSVFFLLCDPDSPKQLKIQT